MYVDIHTSLQELLSSNNLLSGYSTFSALVHLLHKSTSYCHDGGRFYTNAVSTFRFVFTCINFPVLVAYSRMCFVLPIHSWLS